MSGWQDYIPIAILIILCFLSIGLTAALSIHTKKSLVGVQDKDFIDKAVEKKKRQLNAHIGGMTFRQYVSLMTVIPLVIGAASYFLLPRGKAMCIVFAFLGLFVPDMLLKFTEKKQRRQFSIRYAKALRTLASGLRSGMSVEQAVIHVGNSPFVDEHIRKGFRQIASDIQVGIPLNQAFQKFAEDSGNEDAFDVAAAISMQNQVGGSEASVIGTIAQNINTRLLTQKEITALFADTDILIGTMDFLPFVLFFIMYVGAPQMIAPFFESPWMTMILIFLLVLTVIGSFIIRKLVTSAKEGI